MLRLAKVFKPGLILELFKTENEGSTRNLDGNEYLLKRPAYPKAKYGHHADGISFPLRRDWITTKQAQSWNLLRTKSSAPMDMLEKRMKLMLITKRPCIEQIWGYLWNHGWCTEHPYPSLWCLMHHREVCGYPEGWCRVYSVESFLPKSSMYHQLRQKIKKR